MAKLSVTYKAPKDDAKVVEWNGVTFTDGKPVTIDADDPANAKIVAALVNHPLFDVSGGTTAATGQHKGAVESQAEDKEEDDDIKDKDIKKKSRW